MNARGRKWIQYIKVRGTGGEVDAFARVAHETSPISIGEARKLPDGASVVLTEAVISASTFETGRWCYIQSPDRSAGIRLMDRVLTRGDSASRVTVWGNLATVDGERVIRCTALDTATSTGSAQPLGVANKSFGGTGLNTSGLLVRVWGRVESPNQADARFLLDDGSGREIHCIGPRLVPGQSEPLSPTNPSWGVAPAPGFTVPSEGSYVGVTGISSMESVNGELAPVVRMRSADDLTPYVTQ